MFALPRLLFGGAKMFTIVTILVLVALFAVASAWAIWRVTR